ncbi:RICIN domain-containing protein [Aquimarina agarivorans]|uniref:RICIN domain-containing protein n=1 Tax=Aquimarina agarivorans TaxID=980584 RepID=UPI000248EA45|nr:RICIN domain-containing protein [Aquimarina agarivorans]
MKKIKKFSTLLFLIVTTLGLNTIYAQSASNMQFSINNVGTNQLASIEFERFVNFFSSAAEFAFRPAFAVNDGFKVDTAVSDSDQSTRDFQKWQFIPLGNGVYQIVNVRSSKAVNFANASSAPTQQLVNRNDQGQQFRALRVNSNIYRFQNVLTGRFLAASNTALILQTNQANNTAQQWRINNVAPSTFGDPTEVNESFIVAPLPANNVTTLFFNSNRAIPNGSYRILERGFIPTNVSGRFNIKRGENSIEIDVSAIPVGFHRVDIIDGNGRRVRSANLAIAR